jgi:hypothetical protein
MSHAPPSRRPAVASAPNERSDVICVGPESPPTKQPPRPDLRRGPDSESVRPPALLALHPRGGAPRPTAVWHPEQKGNTYGFRSSRLRFARRRRHADRPRRGGRGGSIDRDREYSRRGSEPRILATVGAPDRESPGAAVMISQVTTGDALTGPARSLASAFAGATGDT